MRAPRLLLAALLALLALAAAGHLRRRNPWMSACDLEGPQAENQAERTARDICAGGPSALRAARLPHCRERAVLPALDARARRHALQGGERCARAVSDVLQLDALAETAASDLDSILARYDCGQTFSVIHNCRDCQDAYRRWVCSSLVPLFVSETTLLTEWGSEAGVGAGAGSEEEDTGHTGQDRGAESPRDDAAEARLGRRARTAFSIDTYTGGKNTKLKNNNYFITNNNNNNNNDDMNTNKYDDLLLFLNANVIREYYAGDYAGSGSGSFYDSSDEGGVGGNSTTALSDASVALWSNERPHSKKRDSRPEHNIVEARKELDNRLGARNHTAATISAGGARTRRQGARQEEPYLRVKPCLSVCQDVEQACPYFLPADRAPSYPTQYAGEPTFLCLDPNIQETGEQLLKSNYGIPDCCYVHCGINGEELCHRCTLLPPQDQPYAPQCVNSSTILTASSASVPSSSSSSVIVFFVTSLNLIYSAYNKIVLSERRDAYHIKSVNFVTFDTIYYYIKQIMKIFPRTRL